MDSIETISAMSQELEQLKESRGEFIENLKECGLYEEETQYCCREVLGVEDNVKHL